MRGMDGIQKVRHSNTYNEVSQGSDRYYHCLETRINSDRWRLKRKGRDKSKPFCGWYNMGDQKTQKQTCNVCMGGRMWSCPKNEIVMGVKSE